MHELISQTYDFLRDNGLIEPGDRLLLSLSAGKDSMALVHILHALSEDLGFSIGVFHLNHCMRGDESDLDEEHVRETASAMKIPAHIFRHDFKNNRARGLSFEEDARNVRYGIMKDLCEKSGYTKIAVGHNRSDNVETILMRIFTGTGVYGLRGMTPSRDNIIRPLLHASPPAIYRFLDDQGIRWREDSSNSENSYRRNFLRNRVIPLVTEKFPMLVDAVENLSSVAADCEALLERHVLPDEASATSDSGTTCIHEKSLQPRELFAYTVSKVVREKYGQTLSSSALKEMHQKLRSGRTNISLYSCARCTVSRRLVGDEKFIVIEEHKSSPVAEWEYPFTFPPEKPMRISVQEIGVEFTVSETDHEFFMNNRTDSNYLFISLTHTPCRMAIRNRREGDRMPLEFGPKKLKELFIEKKLDNDTKTRVPLIVLGSDVAAIIPGAVCAAPNRVAPGYHVANDTKKVLALYYTKKQM